MLIPEEVIENIRESNDIVDVISEYVSLQKKGKNYTGLCPFHKEKTPSFSVQQEKQIYHCFGCGEGGNVISFIMKYRNLDFIDAVKMLAEKANIIIPQGNEQLSAEKSGLREKLYNINREAARYFYINLKNNSNAQKYFKNRGIDGNIIKKFGLGYSADNWDYLLKHLLSKGYDEDLAEKAGLIVRNVNSSYKDRFRNRVMFPVFDVKGRVIGFGGRVLDNSKPKYLNSPETLVFSKGNNLYGLNLAISNNKEEKIIIVEGYMDVIALHQYEISNAVASLGTALTKDQGKLLKRYYNEVIICYDSDTAGQAATLRGLDILSGAGCRVSILDIPRGKDPDEFIRAEGKEAFLKCMEKSVPLIEYKIRRKSEGFDVSTTEGKIGFVKSCAAVLNEIDDPVITDAYITKLSNETGVSAAALYGEIEGQRNTIRKDRDNTVKHISGKSRYNNNIDGQKLYLEPAYVKAERFILYILYEMKDFFKTIETKLSHEDFNDITYRKVAGIMYKKLENNEDIVPASIINTFKTGEEMKKVNEIFNCEADIDKSSINRIIDDYVNLIYKSKLISKKNILILKIKEYEEKGDVQQSAQLLKDILEIERQLRMH